jgi:hypothetical protein
MLPPKPTPLIAARAALILSVLPLARCGIGGLYCVRGGEGVVRSIAWSLLPPAILMLIPDGLRPVTVGLYVG